MKQHEPLTADNLGVTRFGRFTLDRASRTLYSAGEPVALSERVMDVLIALIDARGRIVPAGKLLQQSSSMSAAVANNSVLALVSQLRRVLGEDRALIATVPRRGYRLATEWYEIHDDTSSAVDDLGAVPQSSALQSPAAQADHSTRLPLIGRDAELSELLMRIPQHRLVTLMGSQGTGKSRLAHEAATRTASLFGENAYTVDLGTLTLPDRVAQTVAAQIGMNGTALIPGLAGRQALVVIDHCDHVLHELASVIEAIIAGTQASVIVCAEAPLFASGEYVLPLAPLRFAALSEADNAPSDACKLFMAQLQSTSSHAHLEPVCRVLSGNPLALKLAARQIAADARAHATLDDAITLWLRRFERTLSRRRGAPHVAWHATGVVNAVIAQRYYALDARARDALCCASLYARPFSLTHVLSVLSPGEEVDRDAARSLIDSGLLVGENDLLRMSPAVRRFALGRIVHRPDYNAIAERHAHLLVDELSRDGQTLFRVEATIADLRRALAWSLEMGRLEFAARLLQHSDHLWRKTQLVDEQLYWIERTMQAEDAAATLNVRARTILSLSFAQKAMRSEPRNEDVDLVSAWWRVYEFATACADDETRVLALSVLLLLTLQCGYGDDRPELLELARVRISQECDGSSTHRGFTHLRGVLMTLDGCHCNAIDVLTPLTDEQSPYDDNSSARDHLAALSYNALAISLWLTGASLESNPELLRALTEARQQPDPVSRCAAAALACVLFMLEENDSRLTQQARLLRDTAIQHGMKSWANVGQAFLLWTEATDVNGDAARQLTDRALRNIEQRHATLIDLMTLERFTSLALRRVGSDLLLRIYEQTVASLRSGGRGWLLPEALRVNAVLLQRAGAAKIHVAQMLEHAADEARAQRAMRLVRRIAATTESLGQP